MALFRIAWGNEWNRQWMRNWKFRRFFCGWQNNLFHIRLLTSFSNFSYVHRIQICFYSVKIKTFSCFFETSIKNSNHNRFLHLNMELFETNPIIFLNRKCSTVETSRRSACVTIFFRVVLYVVINCLVLERIRNSISIEINLNVIIFFYGAKMASLQIVGRRRDWFCACYGIKLNRHIGITQHA